MQIPGVVLYTTACRFYISWASISYCGIHMNIRRLGLRHLEKALKVYPGPYYISRQIYVIYVPVGSMFTQLVTHPRPVNLLVYGFFNYVLVHLLSL